MLVSAPEVRDNEEQTIDVVTVEATGEGAVLLTELGPRDGAVDDVCGVCGGTGTRCQGCDGVVNSGHRRDVCGVCRGDGSSCLQQCEVTVQVVTQEWAADIIWQIDDGSEHKFGPNFFADNSDTTQSFTLTEGEHTIVYSDNFNDGWNGAYLRVYEPGRGAALTEQVSSTDAVPSGSVDFTVLCEGPIGCDGNPNSGLAYDECDVCGGDGSTCDLRGWACTEGAYAVTLSTRPYSPVSVTVTAGSCDTPTMCDIVAYRTDDPLFQLGGTLEFDSTNWDTPQVIVVYAIDDEWDQAAEPYIAKLLHTVSTYDQLDVPGAVHEVDAFIIDDDHAGVKIWRGGRTLEVTEGGEVDRRGVSISPGRTDTYGFSLYTAPEATVTLSVHWSGEIVVEPDSLTFTPTESGDWPAAHYFTVRAVDDFKVDGNAAGSASVWHTWTSTDPHYNTSSERHDDYYGTGAHDIEVSITDNDRAGVYVSPAHLNVDEGGDSVSYEIWLGSNPSDEVVLALTVNDTDAVVSPRQLSFNSSDWNISKWISIQYVDDLLDEAAEQNFGVFSEVQSDDANYAAVVAQELVVTVHDNDLAGIALSVSDVHIREGGSSFQYTVWLTSQPRGNIVVEVSGPSDDVIVLVPAVPHRLAFNSSNWMVPQNVSIAALDDLVDEDTSEVHHVLHRVVSCGGSDASYCPVVTALSVGVGDDDTAPLPDAYTLCDVFFGPRSGGTVLCLQPLFFDAVVTQDNFTHALNASSATNGSNTSNASNVTSASFPTPEIDESSWAVVRPLYFKDMVLARPDSLECRFTPNSTFGAARRQRFYSPGFLSSNSAAQLRFYCESPRVITAGVYQVEVYVGSGYGEAGWKLAKEGFTYHDATVSAVSPHSGPRSGDTLMSVSVTTSVQNIAPEHLRPSCRMDVDYSTTIGGIALHTSDTIAWQATNYTPHSEDQAMYCRSPPSVALGEPCIDMCTPVCDVPAAGNELCEYCGPECALTVHIRTESFAEEIYFALNGGEEIGGFQDNRDVYFEYRLTGSQHNLTFIDTNGGGWNGGTIELLDTDTGEVVLPAYTVTGTSGVLVDAQWGERQGTIPFTCGRPYERLDCPKVLEECRCPESCETVCGTYGVRVSLNGQQYTDTVAQFDYYGEYALLTTSPYTGPVSGDTVITIRGNVQDHSALGVEGAVPGFVRSDDVVCNFHVGSTTVLVPADFGEFGSDFITCKSPPWASAIRVSMDVTLNGQQYTADNSPSFQYYTPPKISAVMPNRYDVFARDITVAVAINGGVPYRGAPYCKFGGKSAHPAPVDISSAGVTTLSCVGPPCDVAGRLPVFLSFNGQQFESGGSDFFCQPKLVAMNPLVSPSMGGTVVNITGQGFASEMSCRFQGTVVSPAEVNGTSISCVSPAGVPDIPGTPSTVGISADGIYFVEHVFHYVDLPEPISFSPRFAPIAGSDGFPNVQHTVSVVVDVNLNNIADVSLTVGMFQAGASTAEVVAEADFQPGVPAYIRFSSAMLPVDTVGDRRLAFSLNGQQFSQHETWFNYFDPCEHALSTRPSPISGPAQGATISVVGSNIGNVDGIECGWTLEDGRFVSAPGRFLSGSAAECDIPAWEGIDLPHTLPVRVKNSAEAVEFCTQPWGVGSQWSPAVDFTYTRVSAEFCHATAVSGEWKSVAGDVGKLIIQSAWGSDVLASTGGDSFSMSLNPDHGETAVIDLDIDFVDFADFPTATMDFEAVEKAAALLAYEVVSADSLCARTQQLGSCCRALRSECNNKPGAIGKYMGAWTTTVAGEYSLSVRVAGDPIKDSPFDVVVIPGDFSFETSSCIVFFQDSFVGNTQQASIALRDVFGNNRGANFMVNSGETVTVEITVTSAMRAADVYWNLVPLGSTDPQADRVASVEPYTYADNSVHTTSFDVPAARYTLVALSASSYEPYGWHGTRITMVVDGDRVLDETLDDFGASTSLQVIIGLDVSLQFYQCSPTTQNRSVACDYDIEDTQHASSRATGTLASVTDDGTMHFDVTSSISGTFVAIATVNEEHMDCNGSAIRFFPGATDAGASTVGMGPQEHGMFVAGEPALIFAEARDEYGNLRERDGDSIVALLMVDCRDQENCVQHAVPLNVTNGNDDGMYEIRFMTEQSATYALTVWLNEDMLGGSAHSVQVGPSEISLSHTTVSGAGWTNAEAGGYSNFMIETRDRFSNALTDQRVFQAWTCRIPCKSSTMDTCDQFCTGPHGGLFDMDVRLLSRLRPEREPPVEEATCVYAIRYVANGQFEAVYTCTVSGVYSIRAWSSLQQDVATSLNGTTRVKATVADGDMSVIYDLDSFETDAGVQAGFKIQLVDAFGNERFEGLQGQDIRVDFHAENPLPAFWSERPDLDPRSVQIVDDGTGVVLVLYTLYPAVTYTVHVTIHGEHLAGNRTHTVKATATCTGTANEVLQSCTGNAHYVPEQCSGTASDGFTNCTDNYLRFPSGNCTQGLGSGCTYTAAQTPDCGSSFAHNQSAATESDCPAGCTFEPAYTPQCEDAFSASPEALFESECPAGCIYRITRSPFRLKKVPGRAPRLINASLDASLFRITANFDMSTNSGRSNTPGSCVGIFASHLLTSFGSGSTCVWETPSKLVITLGSDTTMLDRLNEEPGCTGVATTIAAVSASCTAPVDIDCASVLMAECGAVGLVHCGDACVPQGSMASSCPAIFAAAADTASDACPAGCLYNEGRSAFTPICDLDISTDAVSDCPSGCIRPSVIGKLRILKSGAIFSEFENSDVCESSIDIDLPAETHPPVAVIVAPKVVSSCDAVLLSSASHGGGTLQHRWMVWRSVCAEDDGTPTCDFTNPLTANTPGLRSILNSSDETVVFTKGTLAGGSRYLTQLQVIDVLGLSATTEWDFIVFDESIPTMLVPHTVEVIDVSVPLAVEVTPQIDPLCMPEGAVIRYHWQQVANEAPSAELSQPAVKDLLLAADVLEPSQDYYFQLFSWYSTAQHVGGVPVGSVHVRALKVLNQSTSDVSLDADQRIRIESSQPVEHVNAAQSLALRATISSESPVHRIRWYALQGTVNLSNPIVTTTGREQQNLVLSPSSLLAGQHYRFRLYITSDDSHNRYGEISIRVNQPPVRGDLLVEPTMGYALSTRFELITKKSGVADWTDDPQDMPIQVRYSYFRNGEEFALSRTAAVPNRIFQLPPGDTTEEGWTLPLQVAAFLTDQYLAETKVSRNVIVQSPVNAIGHAGGFGAGVELEEVVETYVTQIEATAAYGDPSQVIYMITLAAQQLNAGGEHRRRLATGLVQHRKSLRLRMFELGAASVALLPRDQHGLRSSLSLLYSIMQNPCELSYDVARRGLLWAEADMADLHEFTQQDLIRVARISSYAVRAASDTECVDVNAAVSQDPARCENATYRCLEGRCYVESFAQPDLRCVPDGLTHCANGTCTRMQCELGLCPPDAHNCFEGRCSIRDDGSQVCFEGRCPVAKQHFYGEYCNVTAQELELARRATEQKSACMSLNMNAIVLSAVGRFAARQIVGEATVRVTTDAFVLHMSKQLQLDSASGFRVTGDTVERDDWRIFPQIGCSVPTRVASIEWHDVLLKSNTDGKVNETMPLSFSLKANTAQCAVSNAAVAIAPPWSALPKCLMPCYDNLPLSLPSQLTCDSLEALTTAFTDTEGSGRCSVDLGTVPWLADYIRSGTILADICPVSCGVCPAQAHYVTKAEADACFVQAQAEGTIELTCHAFDFASTEWNSEMCTGIYNTSTNLFVCLCTTVPAGPIVVRSKRIPPSSANATLPLKEQTLAQAQLVHRKMKTGFIIPLCTFVVLWTLSIILYSTALLTDARARHQIYMANSMKNTFHVPVLPQRTGECRACVLEVAAFVKKHHLLCSTKFDGLRAHRMLVLACLLFTACAASAVVLVLPDSLRRSGWQLLFQAANVLETFTEPTSTDTSAEQIARRAVLTTILVSPVELIVRSVIGSLRHTEQQAARASLGLGGRAWVVPAPAKDVAIATKVQARFRRYLVDMHRRKEHQAQTMAALEAKDKLRVRLDWATSGVGNWRKNVGGPIRYRAAVKLIMHSGPHPKSPQTGTLRAGTEFEVLEMQAGKNRSGEHATRWFCIRDESEGSVRHGWVREVSVDGTPLCVDAKSSNLSSSAMLGQDEDVVNDASVSDHLSRVRDISSFYRGLREGSEGFHKEASSITGATAAARKWKALLPPLPRDASGAISKWNQRRQSGNKTEHDTVNMHSIAKLDSVRQHFSTDASRRAVHALMEGSETLLTPDTLIQVVVRMQARVRGALERRRLQKQRALALSYPYTESTGRGEARKGGRSSRCLVFTSSAGACFWCALCSYFVLTVTVELETGPALEWLACSALVCATQAVVLWPLALVLTSTASQCFRCCTIDSTVRELFRAMDRNHTMTVDHAEFTAMIDLLGKEAGADPGTLMTEDEINTAFRLMDVDLDGSVSLKEFAHWWSLTPQERADFQSEPAVWSGLSVGELRKARKERLKAVRAKHAAVRTRAKNVEKRRTKLLKSGLSAERATELAEAAEKPVDQHI